MLQQEKPEDYIISSGKQGIVIDLIEIYAIGLGWFDLKIGNSIILKV